MKIMNSEAITFDKDHYLPGDTVSAKIQLFGPYKDNLRKIAIYLGGYIKTHTTSADSDGGSDSHYDELVIMETMKTIEKPVNGMQINLQVQIPEDCPPPVYYEDNNKIEYHCHVKYDLSLASDDHTYVPIPIKVPSPLTRNQSVELENKGLRCRLGSNLISRGSQINLHLLKLPDVDFRSFRIEFRRKIWMEADGHSDTDNEKETLYQTERPNYGQLIFDTPYFDLPAFSTEIFAIEYFIHVVVDIAFGRDINLDIPVYPVFEPLETEIIDEYDRRFEDKRRCSKCGNLLPSDAIYCGICGEEN